MIQLGFAISLLLRIAKILIRGKARQKPEEGKRSNEQKLSSALSQKAECERLFQEY